MKRKLARLAAVAVCAVMVGSLAACGSSDSSSDTSAAAESSEAAAEDTSSDAGSSGNEVLTVGVVYPATGSLAAFGDGTEEMYNYAVDQINDLGGIELDGVTYDIELVFADSESDATKASEAANNLITNKGVQIMMTAKTADTTVPVAAACERAGVLCLSVDTPDEAWATSDYETSYHAGFNTENELSCFADAWDLAGLEGVTERCRSGIGRTFQVPRPFEKMTVFENIMVGGVFGAGMSEAEAKQKALQVASIIKLEDKLGVFAGKLGLLDRKRLEIGRALATEPKILLLDEVGGGLTESEVGLIIDLVKTIKSQGVSVIWIEHIIRTMIEGTDRVMLMSEGVDVITGPPLEVMNSKEVKHVYMGGGEDE